MINKSSNHPHSLFMHIAQCWQKNSGSDTTLKLDREKVQIYFSEDPPKR